MPCRVNRLRVIVPLDVPSEPQWACNTTRPLKDDEVKKSMPSEGSAITDENRCVDCYEETPEPVVTRQVPHYDSAEEEEERKGEYANVPLEVQTETETTSIFASTPSSTGVEMPNVEALVHQVFPTTSAIPPPPPTATGSMKAMHFWYRRLLAHPIYERCARFVHLHCPVPPRHESDETVHMWLSMCDSWWNALACFVARTSSAYQLPADKAWNPYSFSQSVKYARQPLHRTGSKDESVLTVSSAKYFLPPPPSYAMVMNEYRMIASEEEATRAYLSCLGLWWRKACQWAAACNREYAWMNPPPTTGDSAADWARQCEQWRNFTDVQLREEERCAKALELEALLAAFQPQHQQQHNQHQQHQITSANNQHPFYPNVSNW